MTAEGEVKTGTAEVHCEALTRMWKGGREEKFFLKKGKRKERGAVRMGGQATHSVNVPHVHQIELYRTSYLGTHFVLREKVQRVTEIQTGKIWEYFSPAQRLYNSILEIHRA